MFRLPDSPFTMTLFHSHSMYWIRWLFAVSRIFEFLYPTVRTLQRDMHTTIFFHYLWHRIHIHTISIVPYFHWNFSFQKLFEIEPKTPLWPIPNNNTTEWVKPPFDSLKFGSLFDFRHSHTHNVLLIRRRTRMYEKAVNNRKWWENTRRIFNLANAILPFWTCAGMILCNRLWTIGNLCHVCVSALAISNNNNNNIYKARVSTMILSLFLSLTRIMLFYRWYGAIFPKNRKH